MLLQGLNHKILWPLTFSTPWKELGVERTLCALGEAVSTSFQIDFQEKILWAQFLHLLSKKSLKSFMVTPAAGNLRGTSSKPLQNVCLISWTAPPNKNHICTNFPLPTSLDQCLSTLWNAASWAIVFILPQIKLNSQLSSCNFFFSQHIQLSRIHPA